MLRRMPSLRALLRRRRIARLVRETPERTAAEQADAVRRIVDQAQRLQQERLIRLANPARPLTKERRS